MVNNLGTSEHQFAYGTSRPGSHKSEFCLSLSRSGFRHFDKISLNNNVLTAVILI